MITTGTSDGMLKSYARMLADASRDDLEVIVSGNRAYAQKKRIVVPSMPINNTKALFMATRYVMHEEGHIDDTDFDLMPRDEFLHHATNILEDIRIEARQMRRFLGARNRLEMGIKYMLEDGYIRQPSSQQTPAQLVADYVMYRLRVEVLGQTVLKDYADQAEALAKEVIPAGAMARLNVMMYQVENATSTQDCLDLATAVIDMFKEEQEKDRDSKNEKQPNSTPPQNDVEPQPNDDDGQNNANANAQADGGDDGDSDDDQGQPPQGNQAEPQQQDAGDDQDGQGAQPQASGSDPDSADSDGEPVQTSTSGVAQSGEPEDDDKLENLRRIISGEDSGAQEDIGQATARALNDLHDENRATAIEIPPSTLYRGAVGDASQIVGRVGDATKALKRRVLNLLEGIDRERRYNSSSGSRLDTRRMMAASRGETKVFMKRIEGVEMNTAIQVLIDRSGSMDVGQRIGMAVESALALSLSLEGVQGLQSSVAAFPMTIGTSRNGVSVLSDFGERTAHAATRFAALTADGFTPMAEALLWSGCRLLGRREERKILFVVTDGEPENDGEMLAVSRSKARFVLDELAASGVEVIAIGIKIDVSMLFGNSRKVDELKDLPYAVFEMIQSKLLQARAA